MENTARQPVPADQTSEKPVSFPAYGTTVASGAIGSARFKPTLGLHPSNIEHIEGFEEFKGYLAPAQNAFSIATIGLEQINIAREFADRNSGWTDSAKLLNVGTAAEKKQEQMTRAFDGAMKSLTEAANTIDKSLSTPLENAAAGPLAAEIRVYVRGLNTEQRNAFVQGAIKRGDLKSLAAVLGGPSYLSGLTPEMQTVYTRSYHELNEPVLVRRLNATRRALQLLEERGPLVWTEVERAMRGKFSTVAKLRKANDEAERALLMNDNGV